MSKPKGQDYPVSRVRRVIKSDTFIADQENNYQKRLAYLDSIASIKDEELKMLVYSNYKKLH